MAFAAMVVFLGPNGRWMTKTPAHATACILALAAGETDEALFTHWIGDFTADAS